MSNRVDVLFTAISRGLMIDRFKYGKKPGEVIESLQNDAREELSKLKSDDISSVMKEFIDGSKEYYEKVKWSNLKKEFDQKLK